MRRIIMAVALSNMPADRSPATAAISENNCISTVLFMYPMYSPSGGTTNIVISAAMNDMHSTGCERNIPAIRFKSAHPGNDPSRAALSAHQIRGMWTFSF